MRSFVVNDVCYGSIATTRKQLQLRHETFVKDLQCYWNRAVHFATWQYREMARVASFAVPRTTRFLSIPFLVSSADKLPAPVLWGL